MNSRASALRFQSYGNPCSDCGSSDALARNTDGSTKCFSCGTFHPGESRREENHKSSEDVVPLDFRSRRDLSDKRPPDLNTLKWQYAPHRGVSKKTFEFLECKIGIDEYGPQVLSFPYPSGRVLMKTLEKKGFFWDKAAKEEHTGGDLFAQDRFPAGSARAITVTEGALDTASVLEMFDRKYPVVGVKSAQSAKSECSAAYEYLNSFEKIYLCFDSDGPGQEAAKAVARLFDFNKVYLVEMAKKDANEYLDGGEAEAFRKTWWASRRFVPEGILASFSEFDDVIDNDQDKPSIPYPWPSLQDMTYGIRTGEVVLLTAMEGQGKTEFFRAIEHHVLKTTDENIGVIHLEENKARTVKGLVGYEVKKPVHLPTADISKEEIKKVFRNLSGRDERVHLYSHYGSDDPDAILSTVRFMAGACGCKRVFLDHITMVVSGLAGDDERRALDYISTRLAMMTEELDFTLFMISHVNDEGKTRGSRNISKIADLRIDLSRDATAEDEVVRNTTTLTVTKNRYAGKTGPGGKLYFNPETYVLEPVENDSGLPF